MLQQLLFKTGFIRTLPDQIHPGQTVRVYRRETHAFEISYLS